MTYCFDTNAFVGPWRRTYPIDVLPDLWAHIDQLMRARKILIVAEAVAELERGGDDLYAWIKERGVAIVPLDLGVQAAARDILKRFPGMINVRKQRSMGDPFVVGHAQSIGGIVISEETKNGSKERPAIPDVCDALGIRCMNPLAFIRAEGLVFRRAT